MYGRKDTLTEMLTATEQPGTTPISVFDTVQLHEFYPQAGRNITIPYRADIFEPDEWTITFARGLMTLDFTNASVIEVGVGTGINMAGLLEGANRPASFIGTDILDSAITASSNLRKAHGWDVQIVKSDLLKDLPPSALLDVDHIVACIPQVPTTKDLQEGDNYAHYYAPTGSGWDEYGLGLNERLLREATERAPHARITLNLAGRAGIDHLRDLFDSVGRKAEVLHEQMVPQCPTTTVETLAAMEENGHEAFQFYADEDGNNPICAIEAEARRLNADPVFHKVCVLSAGPR